LGTDEIWYINKKQARAGSKKEVGVWGGGGLTKKEKDVLI